jgi:hypothetical protein
VKLGVGERFSSEEGRGPAPPLLVNAPVVVIAQIMRRSPTVERLLLVEMLVLGFPKQWYELSWFTGKVPLQNFSTG